MKGSKNHL